MGVVVILLLALGLAFGEERKSRCEVKHDRCVFDCTNRFPLDTNKREGCELRCKLNLAVCESLNFIERTGKEIREFLEGFSSGG